ncbi:MAG TPA: hypothetical protein VFG10_00255 [Saprospiraceae bacterium]|nr:hypothetical protein [Saprospiraceae bacterium]
MDDEETPFEQITLSLPDYLKDKINNHEISIEGKMYDIKSVSISGDKVTLLVINDPHEENILKKLKEVLTGRKQSKSNRPHQLRPIHTLKYLSPEPEHNISFTFCSTIILSLPVPGFVTNDREIPTPPPRRFNNNCNFCFCTKPARMTLCSFYF